MNVRGSSVELQLVVASLSEGRGSGICGVAMKCYDIEHSFGGEGALLELK